MPQSYNPRTGRAAWLGSSKCGADTTHGARDSGAPAWETWKVRSRRFILHAEGRQGRVLKSRSVP